MSNQERIFRESEGNYFFKKNKDSLETKKDVPFEMICRNRISPSRVLEIGCSNGFRLHKINKRLGSECTGIEPSVDACEDAAYNFPGIDVYIGTADDLPKYIGESFDLVIVNFVLHLVSRDKLFKVISEIDRVLKLNGHLLIGDFFEPLWEKRKNNKIFEYKQDYANLFSLSGLYSPVAKRIENNVEDYTLLIKQERYTTE